jgi:hypothetical protein
MHHQPGECMQACRKAQNAETMTFPGIPPIYPNTAGAGLTTLANAWIGGQTARL